MTERPSTREMAPLTELGERVSNASEVLARSSSEQKNEALVCAADALMAASSEILHSNSVDVIRAEESGTSATVIDRLRLDESRVEAMAGGLRQLLELSDPIGRVLELSLIHI